ncbi:cysteine peptidase family C39 domain-containing protein [Cyclobacterium plantarum]|uniref:cysteine peptidase family C39 domain-containing protein n=1 Tax=Cyclobacterium plantarum TaxID=2716263 RepID=UPI003F719225
MKTTFPFYKQPDAKDCGPTCLRIIAKHYGKLISLQEIHLINGLIPSKCFSQTEMPFLDFQ